jgi:patatin-like phospholipase/acyl hydrolase
MFSLRAQQRGTILGKLKPWKLIILILVAAPCFFAQQVTVEFDHTIDFTKYKTFAIRDGQLNSKNPALTANWSRSGSKRTSKQT